MKVEPRCRNVTGGGGQPPKKLPNGTAFPQGNVRSVKADVASRKRREVSGSRSRADREASTADGLSEYKSAACTWPVRLPSYESLRRFIRIRDCAVSQPRL